MSRRHCKTDKDLFCFICGHYLSKSRRYNLASNTKLQEAYEKYFRLSLTIDYGKPWAPSYACGSCNTTLLSWFNGNDRQIPFKVPRVWRSPRNHIDDCYFCLTDISPFFYSRKHSSICYPSIESSIAPIAFTDNDRYPTILRCQSSEDNETSASDDLTVAFTDKDDMVKFSNKDFMNLTRDLCLSKRASLTLLKALSTRNLVDDVTTGAIRKRDQCLRSFFSLNGNISFCHDIAGLFTSVFGLYDSSEWVLFIDGSVKSLKGILLNINNEKFSVPVIYASNMKENYNNIKMILDCLHYQTYQWKVCCDFKIVQILCGLKFRGNMKYPCIYCLFDSYHKEKYSILDWPERESFEVGQFGVINDKLIEITNVVLPVLHIKLGLFKQFVKSLDENSTAMSFLESMFPRLSIEKVHSGIFIGPQIDKICKDNRFLDLLSSAELTTFVSLMFIFQHILVPSNVSMSLKHNALEAFCDGLCHMNANFSPKMHYLLSHTDIILTNQLGVSDQHGEKMHQTMRIFEQRYEGKSPLALITDFIWMQTR